ncbi:MAG: carbon-nitrogen hydrolase family protein [Ahniella sp.]|nr:carbon-nitrogen hydrolase family protein [Ahniella sp.]
MRIAACPYLVSAHTHWSGFETKLSNLVARAADQGATLLLLPEYFCMELATLFAPGIRADVRAQLGAMQEFHAPFEHLLRQLALKYRLTVVGGSYPVLDDDGRYRNRCTIALADGTLRHQDKRRMTRFENESWGVSAGVGATVIDLGTLKLGVAICYDSEFPLLVRELVDAGANLIAVPSCTDSVHGFHRVQVAARARALESQCFVLQTHTIGDLPESPAIDENHGLAACYGPPDRGFPADGVLAQTRLDQPGLLIVDIDLSLVEAVRRDGQVLNFRDW